MRIRAARESNRQADVALPYLQQALLMAAATAAAGAVRQPILPVEREP